MSAERRGPAVCHDSNNRGGKGEMTKAPIPNWKELGFRQGSATAHTQVFLHRMPWPKAKSLVVSLVSAQLSGRRHREATSEFGKELLPEREYLIHGLANLQPSPDCS